LLDVSVALTESAFYVVIVFLNTVVSERGEELGTSTGYSVRFESVLPRPHAGILFCTVGKWFRFFVLSNFLKHFSGNDRADNLLSILQYKVLYHFQFSASVLKYLRFMAGVKLP